MLTTESVLALAPDDASAKAARGLLAPSKWPLRGADERAVWGECQGSGSKPYQTQVDLAGPAFRCSCPSRKFPCKHGLALLLMRVQDGAGFSAGPPPAWVAEWLASRAEKAQKLEARAAGDNLSRWLADPSSLVMACAHLLQRAGALGVPSFACTPDAFPALMAAAIRREDINAWAAGRGLITRRA